AHQRWLTVHSAVDGQNQCLELAVENSLDVNTLLSKHITSNTYDDRRKTALRCAVSNNESLCTKILLKEGANLNKDPLNCVLVAVRADSHGTVKLLSYGQDTGDMMLRLLLSHGYNVEMCLDFMCHIHPKYCSILCTLKVMVIYKILRTYN
uniref:Uncharacterized protein n=1 Tax=Ficedula albicollis TaxID=59894 RepID=A0A803V0B9_FICAL